MTLLQPSRSTRSGAFTLIELLVVITIIAILAGIALPVFQKVMEKGRGVQGLNNLRQIGLGIMTMANDNDDYIFDAGVATWPTALQGSYIDGWDVFKSPFDARSVTNDAATSPVSYGLNGMITDNTLNMSKWENLTRLVVMAPTFAEGEIASGTASAPGTVSTSTPTAGTHGNKNRLNVLFADSHVETVKYRGDYNNSDPDDGFYWDPLAL